MKIVELYAVPSVRVEDFCDPQIIGEDIHAIGYQIRRDVDGDEVYGVVEIRVIMSAKKFLEACLRGIEMVQNGQLPKAAAPVAARSHH